MGTWSGQGEGFYPTIEPFGYDETVTFGHVGKPFLAYTQRTRASDDGRPLHGEAGYWRVPSPSRVEFVVAHPTGVVEVEEGTFDGTTVRLATTSVGRTATAKVITALEREFVIEGDRMQYVLRMAAVDQPMTDHLRAELRRVNP